MLREPVVEHHAVGALPVQEDRGQRANGVDENPRQQYGREPRVPRVVDEMHEPQDERQDETDDQIAQQPPEQHERDGGAPADVQRLVRRVP